MVNNKIKILVTGASGYIGSRLAYNLSKGNYDIIALCNKNVPEDVEWCDAMQHILIGDVNSDELLHKISELKPNIIIHLISLDHFKSGVNLDDTIKTNVLSTWNLLELGKQIGINKFIYFSTIHVYGNLKENVVDENGALNPVNAYGLTHKLSEDIVNYYANTTPIEGINLRLSNSYGEPLLNNENAWSLVVNDLCKSAFYHNKIVINGDGSQLRDFVHHSTILNAIHSIVQKERFNNSENTFNLCSGKSITILNLARLVSEIAKTRFHKEVEIFINKETKVLDFELPTNYFTENLSNTKINETLDFAYTPIHTGINLIFDFLEKKNKN